MPPSNQFKVSALKTPVVMDGYVMPSEDPVRAIGILMFNCPEGDATGADLDACTVWQGAVYGMDAKGEMDNLQPGQLRQRKARPPRPWSRHPPIQRLGRGQGYGGALGRPDFKECAT